MATTAVQAAQGATLTDSTTRSSTTTAKGLQDQFLRLLAAEMKYQDPLSPMGNTEFVAQVAQLTTVEAINNMKDTQDKMMATSLVGKTVYFEKDGAEYSGTVWGVKVNEGVALLVGDKEVNLGQLIAVG
mgnify:CR=1 FL=1